MNEPFGGQNLQSNNPPAAPAPAPEPGGWAPAPEAPVAPPPPPAGPASPTGGSNPFETTPPPVPPVSGPMQPQGEGMEPGGRKSSLPLIIILAILVILGGLFLASWMGWISLFGLEKLWGGGTKTTTPVTTTTTPTTSSTANVNDAKRKEDLASLKTALKAYYTANQKYPIAATTEKSSDSVALKALVPDYLSALPLDPLSPTYYYGYKSTDGLSFELTAALEDKTDPSGITAGSIFLYKVTDQSGETSGSSSSTIAPTTTTTTTTDTSAPATSTSGSASSSATAN